jgi:hypothetical protein
VRVGFGVAEITVSKPTAFITTVLALVAMTAVAGRHEVDPVWVDETWDVPGVGARCADSIYAYSCARAIEESLLAIGAPGIRRLYAPKWQEPWSVRHGDTLRITLRGGAVANIVDYDCDCESATTHWYLGRVDRISGHVVFVGHYEGYSYLVVNDDTGKIFPFDGFPLASPDGRRVVAASCDLLTGYLDNDLRVWRVAPDSIHLEYRLRGAPMPRHPRADVLSWGPIKPRWIAPDEIRFRTRVHLMEAGHHVELDTDDEVRLKLDGTTWVASFQ